MSEPLSEDRQPGSGASAPADHEAWCALCQLDERERRGETIAAVDAGALRRHLEARIRAERPDLAALLPPPTATASAPSAVTPPRPAWPLLIAVGIAGQHGGGFRTGLRMKPPRAAAGPPARGPVLPGDRPPPPPPMPPITVAPAPLASAAKRAAALVRAALDRDARAVAVRPGLRQRLANAALAEQVPITPPPVPPVPLAAPVGGPEAKEPHAAGLDTLVAERLSRLERETAELEIRSLATGVAPRAHAGALLAPADGARTGSGIVVEIRSDVDDDGLGLESGLLHQEEAEVTIIPDNAWRPLRHDADGPGVARHADQAEGPRGLVEEAEVEIVLPGTETEVLRRREAQPTAIGRFLGALTGSGR